MSAATNSVESNMDSTEDFGWTVFFDFPPTPLSSPRFSPPRLPQPQPPQPFLPLSSSMVTYQGSSQLPTENHPKLQHEVEEEEENIVDHDFPSPTYFPPLQPLSCPLYLPSLPSSSNSTVFWTRTFSRACHHQQAAAPLALFVEHIVEDLQSFREDIIQDRGIVLHLRTGAVAKDVTWLVENIFQDSHAWDAFHEAMLTKTGRSELNQPVFEMVSVMQQLNQVGGSDQLEDVISGGGVLTVKAYSYPLTVAPHGLRTTTPEPSALCQSKLSVRMWLEQGGRWMAELRYGWNLFDTGCSETLDGATLASELVVRWSGGKENRAEQQTVAPSTEIPPMVLSTTAHEENPDEDFGLVGSKAAGNDEVEGVEIGSEGITGDYGMVDQEAELNSRCLGKKKTKERNPGGERRNKRTNGVRIDIPLKDVLQTKEMRLNDAAKHLKVSRSTLKRACREYKIHRWPPRNEHTLISHFRLNESSAVIDQKRIPQPSSGRTLLPSNQVSATNDTNRVTVMASYGKVRIKFRLSWPWRKVELEQQVKKRLPPLVAGTYYVKYKDEDDGLTLIACDEDLEDYISSSSLLGTHSIQVFLEPKVAHEFLVDQL